MAQLKRITHILRHVRRRQRWQRTLDGLAWAVVVSLAVLALAVLGERLQWHSLRWGVALAAAVPVIAAAYSASRRVPWLKAAHAVDTSHGLRDRFQSALQFAQAPDRTEFMQAAIADAIDQATRVAPERAAPLRTPRGLRYVVPAAAGVALATVVPLPSTSTVEKPATQAEQVRRPTLDAQTVAAFGDELNALRQAEGLSEQAERLARKYERILEQLTRGEISREEAIDALADLQRQLEAARAGYSEALGQALARLATALGESRAAEEVAKALEDGSLLEAAEALERLAQEVTAQQLSEREREKLQEALNKAAEAANQNEASGEKSLLNKRNQSAGDNPREPSLLRKKRKKRELERLRREQAARERARRQLDQLRRQLQQASQNLAQQGGQHLRQGAQNLRDLAQQGLDAEQQRKLAQQLEQLRQQLQRQRQQQGGQGQQGQQGQRGQKGQAQRLQRFRLQARGKKPGEGKPLPIVMRKSGKPGEQGKERQKSGQNGQGGADAGQGQGGPRQRVLQMGGEGTPNAQLEIPGMATQSEPGPQGSGESDDSRMNPDRRLDGKLQDSQVTGVASRGPSRSEVILGAAEQGFATAPYAKVYTDYRNHAEDVLERDDIPPGYRFYVRRYFQLIRPRQGEDPQ